MAGAGGAASCCHPDETCFSDKTPASCCLGTLPTSAEQRGSQSLSSWGSCGCCCCAAVLQGSGGAASAAAPKALLLHGCRRLHG